MVSLTPYYTLDLLIAIITIAFLLYKFATRNFDYWKKRDVPHLAPLPFVGNMKDLFLFRSTIGESLQNLYNQFKTPYFGIYVLNKPYLVLKCPELIKSILVTDFSHFADRNVASNEECDIVWAQFLFAMKSTQWKHMRTKISPLFSTAKIKHMTGLINEICEEMKCYIEKNQHSDFIEAKDLCARFASEVIAVCAFGIKGNCFVHENAEFRIMGKKMFEFDFRNGVSQTCYFMAENFVRLFKMSFFDRKIYDFMREVFWATINERKRTNQKRNDLIDIINQIREQSSSDDEYKFEGDRVVAQGIYFFAAGSETVSTTMAFAMYELCLQPDLQTRLREEIKSVLSKYEELTYEALHDLKLMDRVIYETLRKYPVLPFLDRKCLKDFKVPNSNYVIEKGTSIYVPSLALQNDPEYFPEPEKFDPERFSESNKDKFPSFCYLPFGEGPRICIGAKFGMMEAKIALMHTLLGFELERCKETPVPVEFATKSFLLTSKVGLPIKFKKIED